MFLDNLPKPFFALAPLDDVSDTVFRQIIASCNAPDLFFTEFVNVDGLQSPGRPRLLKKLQFVESETSLIAQIWGLKPENFYTISRQIADGTFAREFGLSENVNYVGIDINMGCPEKHVVHNGACSALINNRPLAAEIIKATKDGAGGKLPVSVKTRLGFGEVDLSWPEFLLQQDIDMLTMHGRTRAQMSKVPADWELIGKVRELRDKISPNTKIVGNGDVASRGQGEELATKHKLDGIMIGRGVFADPFAFAQKSPWPDYSQEQKVELYKKHVRLFADTWQADERPIPTLNKFCKVYINGFDGAKELREKLMNSKTTEEILEIIRSAKV